MKAWAITVRPTVHEVRTNPVIGTESDVVPLCVGAGNYLAGRNMEYQQKAELCDEEPINPPSRSEYFWPAFAVGVGLLATLVWVLFLGWLISHAVLAIR
jgi:hypothetical protein